MMTMMMMMTAAIVIICIRLVWLPDGEKILKICLFISTKSTNVTDRHTDRQTPHDGIGRACIALRGSHNTD